MLSRCRVSSVMWVTGILSGSPRCPGEMLAQAVKFCVDKALSPLDMLHLKIRASYGYRAGYNA